MRKLTQRGNMRDRWDEKQMWEEGEKGEDVKPVLERRRSRRTGLEKDTH